MFGVVLLDKDTPVLFSVLIATLAGLGLGAIPTVNTMVVTLMKYCCIQLL